MKICITANDFILIFTREEQPAKLMEWTQQWTRNQKIFMALAQPFHQPSCGTPDKVNFPLWAPFFLPGKNEKVSTRSRVFNVPWIPWQLVRTSGALLRIMLKSTKYKTEFARETNYHKVINILRKPRYIATYRLLNKCNEEEPAVEATAVISK